MISNYFSISVDKDYQQEYTIKAWELDSPDSLDRGGKATRAALAALPSYTKYART